jgi:FkbH-like protein
MTGGASRAEACLARARLQRDLGDTTAAYRDLRAAARSSGDFAFLTKAARFLERLERIAPPPGRPVKIALLFSSTAELLAPLLRLACLREGLQASIYIAPYGNHRQEVIDSQSGLHRFLPDVVIVGTHWRDAHLEAMAAHADNAVEQLWEEAESLWQGLLSRHPCTILQHSFDLPACDAGGYLSAAETCGRVQRLREFNARLWTHRPAGVTVVDLEKLAAQAGVERWENSAQWHLAKQHPGPDALPLLADRYVALIRAQMGLTKKVLVLDLDNTLWGGVVGEDGVTGVQVGPPTAVGEAHTAFQTYAKELKNRGILLAICSKNNEADARAPFQQHDGMVLKEEDFVVFVANWRDKSENLREMARTLNLGLDSFVFVDDDPVEREHIRRELPEVSVVELGADPATFVSSLHATGWFESITLSTEDRQRHASYRANVKRVEAKAGAANLDEFLQKLRMRMHHGVFSEQVIERVAQLLGKTNQFNLTTRRHNLEQVRKFMQANEGWTQYFQLTDAYGDNGIVGLIIAVPAANQERMWEIDTFLMSCRVIGRRAEDYMLRTLLLAAKSAGCTKIRGVYLPTPKNGLAAEVYPRFGFVPEASASLGQTYVWNLATQPILEVLCFEDAGA